MEQFSVIYMGGRQAGCVGLLALYAAGCEVLAVVAYDREVGNLADILGLSVYASLHDRSLREILGRAHLLVCVHGREIVPEELLNLPKLGAINVHPCLYAYKGASPVERLLRDRNPRASVGVHWMTADVDGGEVLVEEFVDVAEKRSVEEVYNALYPVYATVLVKALKRVRQDS